MKIINYIMENWYLFFVAIMAIAVTLDVIIYFIKKMPTEKKKEALEKWLLYMIAEAEEKLGSGTGKLKLSYVYNAFITKFPSLSEMITFEDFSNMVDKVLKEFNELVESNNDVQKFLTRE